MITAEFEEALLAQIASMTNRPASKKYILSDYPEKQLINKTKKQVKLPPALKVDAAACCDLRDSQSVEYTVWNHF